MRFAPRSTDQKRLVHICGIEQVSLHWVRLQDNEVTLGVGVVGPTNVGIGAVGVGVGVVGPTIVGKGAVGTEGRPTCLPTAGITWTRLCPFCPSRSSAQIQRARDRSRLR